VPYKNVIQSHTIFNAAKNQLFTELSKKVAAESYCNNVILKRSFNVLLIIS